MKPRFFDRFLLILVSLLGMAAGLVLLLVAVGIFSLHAIRALTDGFAAQAGSLNFRLLVGAVGLVCFLLFLRLIIGFNKRANKDEKSPAQAAAATVSAGDFGAIQISLSAIDAMVQRHCRANNKVREATSAITAREEGVAVNLKLVLLSDANVPETTAELQKSLKAYVEGLTGIPVKDISVLVVNAPSQQGLQK